MALQHQKHDDWYNKQLKEITELYASSRQAINGPSLKCESSKHPLRIMLQFITASIAHFEVDPRRPSLLLLSTHSAIGNTHEDPSLQATGLPKDLSYTQSVIAHSIEKTIMIPQYLQFGHRSDEEKKKRRERKRCT